MNSSNVIFILRGKQYYRIVTELIRVYLDQLCPTQMATWAKIYFTIWTTAAHWMTSMRAARWMAYFDLSKTNLVLS